MPGFAVIPPPRWAAARPFDRRGLALLAMVLALVIVAAMVSVGYMAAAQQFRVGVAGLQGNAAFYAAEAGLGAALSVWDSAVATLQPGATRQLAAERLSSGDAFEVRLTRIDEGRAEGVARYLMVSTGRARGAWGGRRQVALFLSAGSPNRSCCDAALATGGDLIVDDAAVISGIERVPEAWSSVPGICQSSANSSGPGVAVYGDGSVSELRGAAVVGRPATRRQADERADFLKSADRWFADLAELADLRLTGGTVLDRLEPAVGPGQTCDRTVARNWGAPEVPGHPCFEHLPIIYSMRDLRIAAGGKGQGVLLVEGDLEIDDGFQFFGLVVVRGSLSVGGEGTRLYGAVIVLDAAREGNEVTSGARIDLSRCPLTRALRSPKLYLPHPLAEFAWLEILE